MLCLKHLLLFCYLYTYLTEFILYTRKTYNSPTTDVVIDRRTIDFIISDDSRAQTVEQNHYKTL